MSGEATPKGLCRCEARIAPAILDGYACGNPDCWRTDEALASFETFVTRLKEARGETAESIDRSA